MKTLWQQASLTFLAFVFSALIAGSTIAQSDTAGKTGSAAKPVLTEAEKPAESPKETKPNSDKSAAELWALCAKNDLDLLDEKTPSTFGKSLNIEVKGSCLAALEKPPTKIVLYMNDVPMDRLTARQKMGTGTGKRIVYFFLDRDLMDPDHRKMWEQMFSHRNGSSRIKLALAVNGALPVAIDQELNFSMTSGMAKWSGLIAAVLLFAGIWGYLVKKNVLRDPNKESYSLARVQMAFWFSLVFCSFLGILVATGELDSISSQALILMGISAATAMGSIVVGDKKDPAAAKLSAPNSQGVNKFFRDLIADAGGGDGLHRLQIVGWTLVLGGYFAYEAWNNLAMPEIPQSLLVLLGLSGGTYVGLKSQE
jgi:hypothetical protein